MKTIKELSDIEFDARQKYNGLSMANVAGKSREERRKQQAQYMKAKCGWIIAKQNLDIAVEIQPPQEHRDE